jgi:hypothetical protein
MILEKNAGDANTMRILSQRFSGFQKDGSDCSAMEE